MSVITETLQTAVTVTFLPESCTIDVPTGTTLLHAARQSGVHIDAPCGERGKCGKCRVHVLSGEVSPLSAEEEKLLRPGELAAGMRLSCETRALGAVMVEIPETSRNLAHRKAAADLRRTITPAPFTRKISVTVPKPSLEQHDLRDDLSRLREVIPQIVTADLAAVRELHTAIVEGNQLVTAVLAGDRLIAIEPGDTSATHYGLALDIGTTTAVGYLIDLKTGTEVGVAPHPNPQATFGADVISRIEYAQGNAEHTETLRRSITGAVNTILHTVAEQAHIPAYWIYEVVMVGNTCMSHLFLGIDPVSLGQAPYTPVVTQSMTMTATDLGLTMHPRGIVRTLPNIAGFVGADTVGVLACSDLDKLPGLNVAVDIGTNAEVMASLNGKVIACSTAAGPAFEGAKISQGMRAQPGAIDGVTIGQDLFVHTISDQPALGICGSGIIDALGELRRVGMLESSGRFADLEDLPELPSALRARLREDGAVLVWAKDSGNGMDIILTRQDVREIQLVKAAIYAGIATLIERVGHTPEELDHLFIAGAFGTFINKVHAVAIGLIPNVPQEKLVFLGNAAGVGAKIALISHDEFQAIDVAAHQVGYVELAGDTVFRDNFSMAMLLAPGCDE